MAKVSQVIYPRIIQSIYDALNSALRKGAKNVRVKVDTLDSTVAVVPISEFQSEITDKEVRIPIPDSELFFRYLERALGVPQYCVKEPGVNFITE